MNKSPNVQIRSILELADRMIEISEQGFASCDDDGCLLLNGMVRECAYRLRDAAEHERVVHGTNDDADGGRGGQAAGGKTDGAASVKNRAKGGTPRNSRRP